MVIFWVFVSLVLITVLLSAISGHCSFYISPKERATLKKIRQKEKYLLKQKYSPLQRTLGLMVELAAHGMGLDRSPKR